MSPIEARATPAPTSKISRGARIRGRLPSISAHAEQNKHLSSDEMDTSAEIPETPQRWSAASGAGQTNEEAQVYVHDLYLFVTVQILDDRPAVLITSGKLCEEHGYDLRGPLSGSAVMKPNGWPNTEKRSPLFSAKRNNFVHSCSSPSDCRVRSSTSPSRWPFRGISQQGIYRA